MRLINYTLTDMQAVLISGDTMEGDLDMSGYRIAGLNTSLPPRHTDAVCWSRAVELTREVGHKASEQVMDLKRLCDLKVKPET